MFCSLGMIAVLKALGLTPLHAGARKPGFTTLLHVALQIRRIRKTVTEKLT